MHQSSDLAEPFDRCRSETPTVRSRPDARGSGVLADQDVSVLSVQLEADGPISFLRLRGALSGTAVAALTAQIDQLGCTPCHRVVLDLRQLAHIDAHGVQVLIGLYHYVRGHGGRLELLGASPRVGGMLSGSLLEVML